MLTTRHRRRLRILTYNILLGGEGREERIARVLERADADVIALQEVTNVAAVRRLASRLGMRTLIGKPSDTSKLNLALLSRRRVLRWHNYQHPRRMLRGHLECEIETGSPVMPRLRVHCLHLAARFFERANGEARRMREMRSVLHDIHRLTQTPHVIIGDFNALAPDDTVAAIRFFKRMAELRRAGLVVRGADGSMGPVQRRGRSDRALEHGWLAAGIDPHLDVGVPRLPSIVGPATAVIPRLPVTDRVLGALLARWSVQHLLDLGYTDCYRRMHRRDHGYTVATWMPAARVDYIFADAAVVPRLQGCDVIGSHAFSDPDVATASDHYPVVADFSL